MDSKGKKLAPCGTGGRLLLTANFSHVRKKLGRNQKSGPVKL